MAEHKPDFDLTRLDQQIASPADSLDTSAIRLLEDLQRIYRSQHQESPENRESLQRVQKRLEARLQHVHQNPIISPSRRQTTWNHLSRTLDVIFAVLMVALLIAGIFFLFTSKKFTTGSPGQLDCSHVFGHDLGEQSACQLGQETPMSGTTIINGHQLTLLSAYADMNRIFVKFAVAGKLTEGDPFINTLTFSGALDGRWSFQASPGTKSESLDNTYYDSRQDQTIELANAQRPVFLQASKQSARTTSLHVTAQIIAYRSIASSVPEQVQATLTFTIPFHQTDREATPNRTMNINEHRMTLMRVITTTSETTFALKNEQILSKTPRPGDLQCALDGNKLQMQYTQVNTTLGALSGWFMLTQQNLLAKQGSWTVKCSSTGEALDNGSGELQFTLPPAA